MNLAHVEHLLLLLLVTGISSLRASAQPICDVLLRPAFHYTTDGLSLNVADSSRSYGITAIASWDFGDGTAAQPDPVHTYGAPGTYQVCLTLTTSVQELCSATYCRSVVVSPLTCVPPLDVWFNYMGASTNGGILQPGPGLDADVWTWDFGDGTTSTEAISDHTWVLPGPHFVSLTRQVNGCSVAHGRWVEVDGNGSTCGPELFVDFTVEQNGGSFGFQPNMIANGTIPTLGIWSYGDGTIDTAMVGAHTYTTNGDHQVCFLLGASIPPDQTSCFALVCRTIGVHDLVGVEEKVSEPIQPWPNPTGTGTVHFRWDRPSVHARIGVHDVLGRPLRTLEQVLQPTTSITVDDLPNGSYLLVISAERTHYVLRFHIGR